MLFLLNEGTQFKSLQLARHATHTQRGEGQRDEQVEEIYKMERGFGQRA